LSPFRPAYVHATAHGVLAAFHIPDAAEPVPTPVLERLPRVEADHARTLKGYRQVQYVGGRLALHRACEQLGEQPPHILSTERGAPDLGDRLVGSVSHKRTLAIGMVARPHGGTLGVDLEEYGPPRPSIEEAILRPEERDDLRELDADRRWIALLVRFSIKESIYKAIVPYVGRYVGFHEAQVRPDLEGHAAVRLFLTGGEGPFRVDARYSWLRGRLVTSARIRPAR